MNPDDSTDDLDLDPTVQVEINRACDRFEAEWREGRRLDIGDILAGFEGPAREAIFRDLLAAELECRRSAGETPDVGEYLRRFPDRAETIDAAFRVRSATASTEDVPGWSSAIGSGSAPGRRFRVLRPHARGGLGAVFVALDSELNREVALKEILGHHADDPGSRRRFLAEAEITGGLEHPGIVPVYGLGTYGDGRPYYAMRFIRGDNLKEAIAAFHADEALKIDPGARALALGKLLRRFLDVCNAIDYAHSRGVLHRDIKPGNVIVGKHGETLVVDWGLAKPMGRREPGSPGDEPTLVPRSASGSAETLPGSAVGTPAYMSPEQAAGDLENLGPASDVYGLGASLYCLLAGRAPIDLPGAGIPAVLRAVKDGAIPPPRSIRPDVDRSLEAVCLKALARRPEDRYPTARELADDVERWIADEPVTARREPWPRRLGRWARRHRTTVAATVAVLLTAVVGLSASTIVVARKQAETDEARLLAEANFRKARDAVDRMLARVGRDLLDRRLGDIEEVRRELLEDALEFQQDFLRGRPDDPGLRHDVALARVRAADIRAWLGRPGEAEADYRAGIDELERLAAADPAEPSHRASLAIAHHNRGNLLWGDGRLQDAEAAYLRGLAIQRGLAGADPSHRLALVERLNIVATAAIGRGSAEDLARAEGWLREAEALAGLLIAEDSKATKPRLLLVAILGNLAFLRKDAGRVDEATALGRRAIEVQESLVKDAPGRPIHARFLAKLRSNLGSAYQGAGLRAEAEREYREAIRIADELTAEYPVAPAYRSELAGAMVNLGQLLAADPAGLDEAERLFRAGGAHFARLVADFPRDPDHRSNLVVFRSMVGGMRMRQQRFEEAETAFLDGLAALEGSKPEVRATADYLGNLGMIQHNIGEALRARKRPEEALAYYGKAIASRSAALKLDGSSVSNRQSLSDGHWASAEAQIDLGRHADAAASAARMLPLFPDRWEERYYAAELLGKCAGLAKDAGVSKTYADRAMELLREAVERGFKDADAIRASGGFEPLRDRPDFKALVDGLAR